ncbi:MAG: toll/interleukin-1 receptor domain-containing protein [Defluviicoccus sp.]
MSEVLVSYKREDEDRVALIVAALEATGLNVWWDRHIEGGARWRRNIAEQLEAARCVIVVWSAASVGPAAEFVHDEASRAKARGVLLPVAIDAVSPPLGFGEVQVLDLVGWRGDVHDGRFEDVVAAARALIEGGPRPRPQAGARRVRRTFGLSAAAAAVAAVIGFAADLAGLQEPICRVLGVRWVCGQLGLGGVPGEAEAALWTARRGGDCDALRTYLIRYPEGAFATEAQRRLTAAEHGVDTIWTRKELRLPITVRAALDPFATIEAAKADAEHRAPEDAELACGGLRATDNRLLSAGFVVVRWDCRWRQSGDRAGYACGFDGEAICAIETPGALTREVCP